MKQYKKITSICLTLFFLLSNIGNFSVAQDISLNIQGQGLIIGTPDNLNLGSLNKGESYEFTFSDYFWIQDLRGDQTGHYTSIQCDGFYGPDGYSFTGIMLKTNELEKISEQAEGVNIYSNTYSGFVDITTPQIFFYRNSNPSHVGYLNRYGSKPTIKFTIPSDAPNGTYRGKIVYTLYDIPVNL